MKVTARLQEDGKEQQQEMSFEIELTLDEKRFLVYLAALMGSRSAYAAQIAQGFDSVDKENLK